MTMSTKARFPASASLWAGGVVGAVVAFALLGGEGPLEALWANDVVALVDENCVWSRKLIDYTRESVPTGNLADAPLTLLPKTKPDGELTRELCAAVSARADSFRWRLRTILLPEHVVCRTIVEFARERANSASSEAVPAFFQQGVSTGTGFTAENLEALGLPVPDGLRAGQ